MEPRPPATQNHEPLELRWLATPLDRASSNYPNYFQQGSQAFLIMNCQMCAYNEYLFMIDGIVEKASVLTGYGRETTRKRKIFFKIGPLV